MNCHGDHALFNKDEKVGYKITTRSPLLIKEAAQFFVINPIKSYNQGASLDNVGTYRNFLIELDTGTTFSQEKYIEQKLKMPWSMKTYSGGKSIHYIISLSAPVQTLEDYTALSTLLLAVVKKADPKNKNPNRLSRTPGQERIGKGKKVVQELLGIGGRFALTNLMDWLYETDGKACRKALAEQGSPIVEEGILGYPLPDYLREFEELGIPFYGKSRHDSLLSYGLALRKRGLVGDELLVKLKEVAGIAGIESRGDVEGVYRWIQSRTKEWNY